jgi:hypothetical protein
MWRAIITDVLKKLTKHFIFLSAEGLKANIFTEHDDDDDDDDDVVVVVVVVVVVIIITTTTTTTM